MHQKILIFGLIFLSPSLFGAPPLRQAGVTTNCGLLELRYAPTITDVQVDNELADRIKQRIPRYEVRQKFLEWLTAARKQGVQVKDGSGFIELDAEFHIVITLETKVEGQSIRVVDVAPKGAEAAAADAVEIRSFVSEKMLQKVPQQVRSAYTEWLVTLKEMGLFRIRKELGGKYHDEALKGDRVGQRSIRLNQQWRAIYVETAGGIDVIEITPHKY